jgi:mannose-6-phosphate isomerase-like protein (cupin superfamily)
MCPLRDRALARPTAIGQCMPVTKHRPNPISLHGAIESLTFLPDRTPSGGATPGLSAFLQLSEYRDGGIFVGHWAGQSEWERHTVGDEIVMVVDGSTTIFFLSDDGEESARLAAGTLIVVPEGTWHRFETPEFVKLLSVTPQPTDHSSERPS